MIKTPFAIIASGVFENVRILRARDTIGFATVIKW